jgi:hypothetical protein
MLWLQIARVGCGALTTLLLGKGLDLSTDSGGHELVTYLGFYGAGGLFALATGWLSIVIHRHKESAVEMTPRTRPMTWGDLRTMRVPLETGEEEALKRTAKRGARYVHSELDANLKKVNDALNNGYWWNVGMEGLQSAEWQRARDSLADDAPKVYDTVAPVYVLIGDMNDQANNHLQGGHDDFDENTAKEMRSLRGKTNAVQRALRSYYES